MKRTIKLRPQEPDAPERKVRLRLPGRLAGELDEYRSLYVQAHGHEIELAALIEGILEQFLASDRFFQRRQRGAATVATAGRRVVGECEDPRAAGENPRLRGIP